MWSAVWKIEIATGSLSEVAHSVHSQPSIEGNIILLNNSVVNNSDTSLLLTSKLETLTISLFSEFYNAGDRFALILSVSYTE